MRWWILVRKLLLSKKDLVPGISIEGASTIYLKGIFGPVVECPLIYISIGLANGGQVNVVHQQVLCALEEVLVVDVLLPPDVLVMFGLARREEKSLAQSSQYLGGDSGDLGETEVSSGILLKEAPENVEDLRSNITSCWNEVGTTITKDKEVTAETDKGSMVADSFRSEKECWAELALTWEHAKEGKGNYYEVDGYLFHGDKILGKSIGQLLVPECRWTDVLRLAHTSVFNSHMGPKKTFERIKEIFYVGDLISCSNSFEEAFQISRRANDTTEVACIDLRKWISNDANLMKLWHKMILTYTVYNAKVLGLSWDIHKAYSTMETSNITEFVSIGTKYKILLNTTSEKDI
ncbi:uncharacterized protein NPIL_680301 [Nephila pilipes]|uniref:Uncharacterized protein n=1 Tax=Nephila pilipes TaxID=299642 RepID=A0A8X6R438_NEPPI|nr:uncharacterized protein NPIL_680301 [Nephila pilipes]